jgi:4-hydroxybenzoate polyprenyltransferase
MLVMRDRWVLYLNLIRWDRPTGWLLLLWPSLAALWVAADGFPGWHLVVVFVLGTVLMRSAGCCLNDVADREFDKHVKRTANRPVTTGAVGVKEALVVGAVLALLAFVLVLTTNPVAVVWSFAALAVAVIYPYAKRWFAMPQAVLGVAFSFGIPMAFAAIHAQGQAWSGWAAWWHAVPPLAWGLLLTNLFWVLAYDTEYAMVDRDDDIHLGIQTSAITLGRWDVAMVMAFYATHLLGWTVALDLWSAPIWWATLALACGQVAWHYVHIKDRQRDGCFKAFRVNHWLGLTVFVGVALTRGV